MAVGFSITVKNEKDLMDSFSRFSSIVGNTWAPMKEAVNYMEDEVQIQHDKSGARFGKRWEKLSNPYRSIKLRIYGRKPILEATGKMRRSYSSSITSTKGVISNKSSYFKYHQIGTSKIPQRIMLMIDNTRQRGITTIFSKHITSSLKKSFS